MYDIESDVHCRCVQAVVVMMYSVDSKVQSYIKNHTEAMHISNSKYHTWKFMCNEIFVCKYFVKEYLISTGLSTNIFNGRSIAR